MLGTGTWRNALPVTALYSACHLIVDMCCAALVSCICEPILAALGIPFAPVAAVIAYDFLAFVMQAPVGLLCDTRLEGWRAAAAGCGLIVVAWVVSPACTALPVPQAVQCFMAACACGLGNALYHIGGADGVLSCSGMGRAALPGVFVSTGAIGLLLGASASKIGMPLPMAPVLAACVAGISIVVFSKMVSEAPEAAPAYLPDSSSKPVPMAPVPAVSRTGKALCAAALPEGAIPCIALMLAAVCLRSTAGFAMAFPWKSGFDISMSVVICVAAGKAAGGFAGDSAGRSKAASLSLIAASLLFLLSWRYRAAGMLAAFLFNMTMPITLMSIADLMWDRRLYAFGLTTVALFAGALPRLLGFSVLASPEGLAFASLLTLVLLERGFSFYDKAVAAMGSQEPEPAQLAGTVQTAPAIGETEVAPAVAEGDAPAVGEAPPCDSGQDAGAEAESVPVSYGMRMDGRLYLAWKTLYDEMDSDRKETFSRLFEARNAVASDLGEDPAVAVPELVLCRIAAAAPSTRAELLAIDGMGSREVDAYGDALLGAVGI